MLWKIIKAYWQNRKTYNVLIINPGQKDIWMFDTEKVHVEIKARRIPSGNIVQEIDYVDKTRIKGGIHNDGLKIRGLKPDAVIFDELKN